MEHSPRRIAEPLRRFFDRRFAAVDARLDQVNARLDSLRDEGRGDRESDAARDADTAAWRDQSRAFQEDAADWLRGMTSMLRESATTVPPGPETDVPATVLAAVAAAVLPADAGPVRVMGSPVAAAGVALALRAAGIAATCGDEGAPSALVVVDSTATDVRVLRTLVADGATLVAMGPPLPGGDAGDVLDLGPRWSQGAVRFMAPGGAAGWDIVDAEVPGGVAVVTARAV